MTELTVSRALAAPPERVWRAFTNPEELAAWLWPGSWQTEVQADVRVGGRYRIASPVSGMALTGEYVAVDPVTRLVQTWRWDGEDEETLVTITIEPATDGSTLTVLHERFDSHESRDNHLQGWNDCLDRLPSHVA